MKFKDCTDEFIVGRNYSEDGAHYNYLKAPKTNITTATTLIFANGKVDGPIVLGDEGEILDQPNLEVVKTIFAENPSEYLKQNQDLANSVMHILVKVPVNEE